MAETMIERVAKAMAKKCNRSHDWPFWIEEARAAIEELREPTKSMVRAAAKSMSADCRPIEGYVSNKVKHRIRYQAMIDAALSEGGE